MAPSQHPASRSPLSAREYAFLGCTILFWAAFVVLLGKDTSWDFRNYHWYGPYALFNDRLSVDVAVAHLASWYNPYLDVPFYLLATHVPAWAALACLGAVLPRRRLAAVRREAQVARVAPEHRGARPSAASRRRGGKEL